MYRPFYSPEPGNEFWRGGSLWEASNHTQNILIPLEVDSSNTVTGYFVLDDQGFPDEGQKTLFDYAGDSFREGSASLTIHHELGDPTLEDGYSLTLLKLAYSIDHANYLSRNHAIKTAFWAKSIARRLGLPAKEADHIELASKLHDVGKVVVPKSVMTKPEPLTAQEWKIMRRHPTFGAMIMKPSARLHPVIPYVKSHHERFDGAGYPEGLAGEKIPIQARIIAVADAYVTITDGRIYQPAGTREQALQELYRCSGWQFDPLIVSVIVDLVTSGSLDDSRCSWETLGHPPAADL